MQHAVIALALGVACVLSVGTPARAAARAVLTEAAEPTRVVLIAEPGMEELVLRFVAELDSLHLEVVRGQDAEASLSMSELEDLARAQGARVAVRVGKAGRAVDLWLVSPESHELVYRRVVANGDPAVLVLRSLEILRGALIDLRAVQQEPEKEAPPPRVLPPPRPPAEPPPPPAIPASSWVGLSGAMVAPHAGRSFGAGATLTFHQRLAARFALHAELMVPLSAWSVSGEGGLAKVRVGTANCAALVTPWGDSWLSPALGLGVGALLLHTQGQADAGYQGSQDLHAAVLPHGRLELGVRLSERWRLRAALIAGFASPRPVLIFGEKREEGWLNPLLVSSLGVETALP